MADNTNTAADGSVNKKIQKMIDNEVALATMDLDFEHACGDEPIDDEDDSIDEALGSICPLLDANFLQRKVSTLVRGGSVSIDGLKGMYALGERFYQSYQLKEAEIVFGAYSTLAQDDHRGAGGLAAIALERGEFEKALTYLNMVKVFPTCNLDETLLDMAFCYHKLDDPRRALAVYIMANRQQLSSDFYKDRYEYLKDELDKALPGVLVMSAL